MRRISVQRLFDDNCKKLELAWVAGKHSTVEIQCPANAWVQAMVGHFSLEHPLPIQVLDPIHVKHLADLDATALKLLLSNFYTAGFRLGIVAPSHACPDNLAATFENSSLALISSAQTSEDILAVLQYYLPRVLADTTTQHGVFMEVLGMGMLITGDAGIGKSELALELISRGHRLIADDVVELIKVAPDTLEGHSPEILQDFLEVRGLGLLNIRSLFGETAVKIKKNLKLIVHLEKASGLEDPEWNRLEMQAGNIRLLGVDIPRVCVPVAAGRNTAVLLEVAVRNHILRLRGASSSAEFMQRHETHMRKSKNGPQ
jgi:HPr kinase/phosphorylase